MFTIMLPITLSTAAGASILNLWLGTRIIRVRLAKKVLIGDGGDKLLAARMRAQLNFAEYTPIILILIGLIELASGTGPILAAVAGLYILARVLHAFGMDGKLVLRQIGTIVTLLTTAGLALFAAILPFIR